MDLLIVDEIDHTLSADGRYKKEYWGKVVVGDAEWIAIDEDGYAQVITKEWWINLFKQFENEKKEKTTKISVSDLLELKEKFTVDEIIRLKNEGLI